MPGNALLRVGHCTWRWVAVPAGWQKVLGGGGGRVWAAVVGHQTQQLSSFQLYRAHVPPPRCA